MYSTLDRPYKNKLCSAQNSILLAIDFQPKVFSQTVGYEAVKHIAAKVLKLAELFQVPTILCEQYPKGLGHTDPDLVAAFEANPSDKIVFEKLAFGCCGEASFLPMLREKASAVAEGRDGIPQDAPVDLIVMGIETHVCVLQTALGLLDEEEYRVVLVDDAITGRCQRKHQLAISRLQAAGAVVSNFESIAFEWTRSKGHPQFKSTSALIRE